MTTITEMAEEHRAINCEVCHGARVAELGGVNGPCPACRPLTMPWPEARCVGHDLKGGGCPVRDTCQRFRTFKAEFHAGHREWPNLIAFPSDRPCEAFRRPTA